MHNCAWNADPYVPHYARLPDVGYIDMGLDSDLAVARNVFPHARRAVMVTPMDLTHKDLPELRRDLERCARDYGPCDVVRQWQASGPSVVCRSRLRCQPRLRMQTRPRRAQAGRWDASGRAACRG